MAVHEQTCPKCQTIMTFIKEAPPDFVRASRRTFSSQVASLVYECPEHGQFRIFVSGRIEPYTE
jgi:hypothetical protein